MQTHRDSSDWPTYEVNIKITVKAKDHEYARRSFLTVICGNHKQGKNFELLEKGEVEVIIYPKEDVLPEIPVTKKEVT
jgi:hypothetical protein